MFEDYRQSCNNPYRGGFRVSLFPDNKSVKQLFIGMVSNLVEHDHQVVDSGLHQCI
jgi:hypothetical protein